MRSSPSAPAEGDLDEAVYITTPEQLRAVNNVVRHKLLQLLRDRPATITQLARQLGMAKGSSSYHIRLLERAGLVKVVGTRKVRGVVERYYGHTARRIVLPEPAGGAPDVVMRHAVADLEASPADVARLVRMVHVRLGEDQFDEFSARLRTLLDELRAQSRPGQPRATLAFAFFRPGEISPRTEKEPE